MPPCVRQVSYYHNIPALMNRATSSIGNITVEHAIQDQVPEMAGCERSIQALAESTSRSVAEVRTLFVSEYARLAAGAKIRAHLPSLVTSNVRALLRRAS